MDRAMVTYLMASTYSGMFWTPLSVTQIQDIAADPTAPSVYDPNPATNSRKTSDIRFGRLAGGGDTYDAGIAIAVSNLHAWADQTFLNVTGGNC